MLKINVIGNLTSDFELRTKPNEELPYTSRRRIQSALRLCTKQSRSIMLTMMMRWMHGN